MNNCIKKQRLSAQIETMSKENKSPWLSVVIPVFNAEKYLEKCISSVLKQSFYDFELLLVNDGSMDRSDEICRKYAETDQRIRYFHIENSGSLKARVYGTLKAEGKYLLFCDADDFYCDEKAFEKLFRTASQYEPDIIEFGFCKTFKLFKTRRMPADRIEFAEREEFINTDYPKLLCSHWDESRLTTTVWDKLYKRELAAALPDTDSFAHVFMGDDIILNLYLTENCHSAVYMPDALYCYHVRTGSSAIWKKKTMQDLNQIKEYQMLFLDTWEGKDLERVKSTLFSEIAFWLLAHIKDGIQQLSDSEMKAYIADTLELPAFVKAREFFLNEDDTEWEAVELLRKADPQAYINAAHTQTEKEGGREKIKKWIKNHI